MNISKILIFTFVLFCTINSYSAEADPFNTVQRFFAAISAHDYSELQATLTGDFHLLEVGEIWDANYLLNVLKKSGKKFKRRNYFSVIKAERTEEMAWISYWNKADKDFPGGKQINSSWLESAILIKINNVWKVQMLHSTKVKPETIPADVVFEEYIN